MKNRGLSDRTIKSANNLLKIISEHADLNNPETVKQWIANLERSTTYKGNLCDTYAIYCKHYGIDWEKPRYTPDTKMIKIPTKEKLEMLIASAGRILSAKLQISMETGMRSVEICNLKARDIDVEHKLIYPTTAKHGSARICKISNNLAATLQTRIIKHKLNPNDKLFKGDSNYYGNRYREVRDHLAQKLNDPTLRTIRLYDFRHYFATMLYARTRDILLVKQQMGHKRIDTTLIYTQLLHFDNEDEYTTATANNLKDAQKLIENGFEYITEIDGYKIFRKRK